MLSTLDGLSGDHFYFSNRMIIRDIPPGRKMDLDSEPAVYFVVWIGSLFIFLLVDFPLLFADFELRVDVYGLEVNKKSHAQKLSGSGKSSPKKTKVSVFDMVYVFLKWW